MRYYLLILEQIYSTYGTQIKIFQAYAKTILNQIWINVQLNTATATVESENNC